MDYKRNEDILKQIKLEGILDKISKYKTNFIQHADRMRRDSLSELLKITKHLY